MDCLKVKILFKIPFFVYHLVWLKGLRVFAFANKKWRGYYYWNVIGYEDVNVELH